MASTKSTHYTLSVNSGNVLRLTHKFQLKDLERIREVITFQYRRLYQGEKVGIYREDNEHIVRGICTAEIDLAPSRQMLVVRLQSGGPEPFKMAKVTLSLLVGVNNRRIEVVLTSESQSPTMFYGRGLLDSSRFLDLQIVAYLHEDKDEDEGNSDLGIRLNDEYMSDIKVVAGESSFHCHKLILASRSDVFKAMFSHGNVKECVDGELILEDDPAIVEDFLQFLYTYKVKGDLDENSATKLLVLGDMYNVTKLKKTCLSFLAEHIDIDNCCRVLGTARLIQCDILEKKCCAFIAENVAEVMKTKGWEEMDRELFKVILEKNASE